MCTRSKKLCLRELEEKDLACVLAYRERSQEKRSCPGPAAIDAGWSKRQPDPTATGRARSEIHLAIALAGTSQLVGVCRVNFKDAKRHEAEVFIDFDPQPQLEEAAAEAAATVIRLGFEEFRLQRIFSWCLSLDASTTQMLEGAGMQLEAVLPGSLLIDGRWWDTSVYSIQKDEWTEQRGE